LAAAMLCVAASLAISAVFAIVASRPSRPSMARAAPR
jgi:hypothetical protein